VSLVCAVDGKATDALREVQSLATLAIVLYPIGQLVLFAALLLRVRRAIYSESPTHLSRGIAFLYREYDLRRGLYWWELCEMSRRFVLCGLFVLVSPGSITQIIAATFFCTTYLALQVQLAPYRDTQDNYMANVCSFSLVITFLCCTVLKMSALLEPSELVQRMSAEQRDDAKMDESVLASVLFVNVVAALVVSLLMMIAQIEWERRQKRAEMLAATAKRLRSVDDDELVRLPAIQPGNFHVFLSHVWGTGQDQMRIVKLRLGEMLPDVRCFLDVDDLREGKGAEFVDKSEKTLVFCSAGYFQSPNCMRELLRAVVTRKPVIALLEVEAKHGGMTRESTGEAACDRRAM